MSVRCFFAGRPGAGACSGRLVRAHLLPKQVVRREFPEGAVMFDGEWRSELPSFIAPEGRALYRRRTLDEVLWDERVWAPMCGGPTGIGGHHGRFDGKQLRLERADLPGGLEAYAAELGLGWWLDREYGEREEAA